MKHNLLITTGLMILVLLSCGPNAEQQAQEAALRKHHDDSISSVAAANAQQAQQQRDADAEKAKQDKENATANLKYYQQQLDLANANMDAANTKMNEIQSEDCWLQSCKDAKVIKVRDQSLVIQHLKDAISDLQSKITDTKAQLGQ